DGAQGVLMNITGGMNLSLYEVQEAADIVASAADQEVNMIFCSVINEDLKDEIVVTVIATGFNENVASQPRPPRAGIGTAPKVTPAPKREKREEPAQDYAALRSGQAEDPLDIPAFLRNRNRRR
ncbi:cell division protein FtsZ, partial [Geobacillus stearothermophilus]|nr:cell division protein FtsZ [Geobacillus stearothermophilus]